MTVLGSYRLIQKLGEGGMGEVFIGEHAMLGRRAAVKVLRPEFSHRQDIVARFFNEARAATQISDAGIVQIFDFGQAPDGTAYIVMELLDGEALDRRIQRQGVMQIPNALRLVRQVASSLAAAHSAGIVHRDLKPENIFVIRDAEVAGGERTKILDFGIAKLFGDQHVKTHTSAVMGTPMFMSPEQCRGSGQVDHRADIYSLGCVLYLLVTGRLPFEAEGSGDLIAMHLREVPAPPSTKAAWIPPALDRLILRCLAKNPADRFQTGTDLATAIAQLLETTPTASAPNLAPTIALSSAGMTPAPTTLSSAVGAVGAAPSLVPQKSRTGLIVGMGIGLVGAIVVAVIALQGGGTNDGPANPPAAATEPTTTEPTTTVPANAGATDPAKTDATKTDAAKTDATKTDATKTDATKTDATKTDAAKTDSTKTDPTADPTKTGATTTDWTKTDPKTGASTDPTKTGAAKTGATTTDPKTGATKTGATTTDPKTGATTTDSTKTTPKTGATTTDSTKTTPKTVKPKTTKPKTTPGAYVDLDGDGIPDKR